MRFNFDANSIGEATIYIENRILQLGKFKEIIYIGTEYRTDIGVIAYFLIDGVEYMSIYILKNARGKGKFLELYKEKKLPILTSIQCELSKFLEKNNIPYISYDLEEWPEYKIIRDEYGDKRAKRSGVFLMNHIDEGLAYLSKIDATEDAKKAYCLHPIIQTDEFWMYRDFNNVSERVLNLAIEYARVANAYLSTRKISSINEIELSKEKEVNDMLKADKIQNCKDFILYHQKTHPRSKELLIYFNNWFERLGLTNSFKNKFGV